MPDNPATQSAHLAPARTGACPFCLRGHMLRARGYDREVGEDPSREWEEDNLLENLLLAGDHARALGDGPLAASIRAARHAVEEGTDALPIVVSVYETFKKQYFPKKNG